MHDAASGEFMQVGRIDLILGDLAVQVRPRVPFESVYRSGGPEPAGHLGKIATGGALEDTHRERFAIDHHEVQFLDFETETLDDSCQASQPESCQHI